eukprot:scaffold13339_cov61-Phaeocystis_antarctica.AAC.1
MGAVSGYTAAQMPDLRKHIASEGFLTAVAALEGMRVRGAPPLEVVKYVFNSRQAILLQALLGHKHSIPSVPIVDWLIRTIRVLVAQEVSGFVASNPLPPFALTRRAASWRQLERMGGADPVWVSVQGLRGTPCHRMAML